MFTGRFDDPSGLALPEKQRFRTTYCATQRVGAFGEIVADFRRPLVPNDPPDGLLIGVREIDDEEPFDPREYHGVVPPTFCNGRYIGTTHLDSSLNCVDLAAGETVEHLRYALAQEAADLGLNDVDFSVVLGPHRQFTRTIARYIHSQLDHTGKPRYAGIRYLSHLNLAWECWAIFADRLYKYHSPKVTERVRRDDPGLIEAANFFHLEIR